MIAAANLRVMSMPDLLFQEISANFPQKILWLVHGEISRKPKSSPQMIAVSGPQSHIWEHMSMAPHEDGPRETMD